MSSTEWVDRRNASYQKRCEELEVKYAQVVEELGAKELYEHELEVKIKDLKAQLVYYDQIEDKLALANRNARVLEEENNNLHLRIKTAENAGSDPVHRAFLPSEDASNSEALKLIEENNSLIAEKAQFVEEIRHLNKRCHELEQEVDIRSRLTDSSQQELLSKIRAAEAKYRETERQYQTDKDSRLATIDLLEKRVKQLHMDKMELLSALDHAELASAQKKETRVKLERSGDQQLAVLKEDLSDAERRLAEATRSHSEDRVAWQAEKKALQTEIERLSLEQRAEESDEESRKRIRNLTDQLGELQAQILKLTNEKTDTRSLSGPAVTLSSSGAAPQIPSRQDSDISREDAAARATAELLSTRAALEAARRDLQDAKAKRIIDRDALLKENNAVLSENFTLKEKIGQLQDKNDDLSIRCRELEVDVAAAKKDAGAFRRQLDSLKHQDTQSLLGSTLDLGDAGFLLENKPENVRTVAADLSNAKKALAEAQEELEKTKYLAEVRNNEHQAQIEELLTEMDEIRRQGFDESRAARGMLENAPGEGGQFSSSPGKNAEEYMSAILKMNRDKTDSVDDLMRQLEAAWALEDEAKRNANYFSRQAAEQKAYQDEQKYSVRAIKPQESDDGKDAALRRELDNAKADRDRLDENMKRLEKELAAKDAQILAALQSHTNRDYSHSADDNPAVRRLRDQLAQQDDDIRQLKNSLQAAQQAAAPPPSVDKSSESLVGRVPSEELQVSKSRVRSAQTPRGSRVRSRTPRSGAMRDRALENIGQSQLSMQSSEERRRNAVPDGAHLQVTIVELSDLLRNGRAIIEPGYIMLKLKSVKEKYKTSTKELASVVRFDETFIFYLAQPDLDMITVHVYYKVKNGSREYHIGDAAFSMATLYRGVPRKRIAPVAQNPGTKDARRAGTIEVIMQTDDFGKMTIPSEAEVEDERLRFLDLERKYEVTAPEKLHAVDVYMAEDSSV